MSAALVRTLRGDDAALPGPGLHGSLAPRRMQLEEARLLETSRKSLRRCAVRCGHLRPRSEEERSAYVGKLLRMQPGQPGAEKAVAQFLKAPALESEQREIQDRTRHACLDLTDGTSFDASRIKQSRVAE